MEVLFTIGFRQKTAREFFTLLEKNSVSMLVDIRLNNTSQLCAFTKFPDIDFFTRKILGIDYVHELCFAPSEEILSGYRKKLFNWNGYEDRFFALMSKRNISDHILKNYSTTDRICLLCSEPTQEKCHRRLVAEKFVEVFGKINIVAL